MFAPTPRNKRHLFVICISIVIFNHLHERFNMNTTQILADVINSARNKEGLPWVPYTADGRTKTDIVRLYDDRGPNNDGPSAALVRYHAGARTQRHVHPGYELIFVLDGVLHNDAGAHTAGTIEVCPPNSSHELWSDEGCTFLVVWEQPVKVVQTRPLSDLQAA
jgi:quercetin dioxygenase-like cupin family protein